MKLNRHISGFNYIKLAIVVWRKSGLSRLTNFDSSAGEAVKEILQENKDYVNVIDGNHVLSSTDGALTLIINEIISSEIETHFINIDSLQSRLINLFNEFEKTDWLFTQENNRIIIFKNEYQLKFSTEELFAEINKNIDGFIKNELVKSFTYYFKNKEFKELSSTPILATGEYDASSLISNPDIFTWTCIRLCDLVLSRISNIPGSRIEILTVNLRSSPFANSVSLLLNLPMRTIDHLGPNQMVWDYGSFYDSKPNTTYVLISDFIFGGTELKLADLFAKYNYSTIVSAIALGTLLEPERYAGFEVKRLFHMNGLHSGAKYKLFIE